MTAQMTLDFARAAGERALRAAESNAERREPKFSERAAAYMYSVLVAHGPQRGEALTDACVSAGFDVTETRAYGAAFQLLTRRFGARVVGQCPRRKGHGSSGGKVYGL